MPSKGNSVLFFVLYAFVLYAGALLLFPYWGAVLCALSIGFVFYPMHLGVKRRLGPKKAFLAPIISDVAVLLFFVIPIVLVIWAVISEVHDLMPLIRTTAQHALVWIRTNPLNSPWANRLPEAVRNQLDVRSSEVQDRLVNAGNRSLSTIANLGTTLAGNTLGFILDLLVFLIVTFFVFRDGPALAAYCVRLLPMDESSKKQVTDKLKLTVVGVMRGTFLTSLVQGICAGIGFLIVGTEGSILLGVLTALASLIPSVGTALVWMPVALIYFFTGHIGKGIFMTAWGFLVVGVIDNLARPYIVGSKADIPFVWLFLGILGGIEVFGPLGLLVGPLIIVMVPVFSDIYLERYQTVGNGAQRG